VFVFRFNGFGKEGFVSPALRGALWEEPPTEAATVERGGVEGTRLIKFR